MRKILAILLVSVLLLASFAHVVLADLKPTSPYIPQAVTIPATIGFNDLWVELDPSLGGSGIELPQGQNDPFDDFIRGGVAAGGVQHGIPIGFTFNFMQGPARGIPVVEAFDPTPLDPWNHDTVFVTVGWNYVLDDQGFNELYVSLNGYVVFDTVPGMGAARPAANFTGLGTQANFPTQLQSAEVPNDFIAPFWTNLTIGENAFTEVTSVHFVCDLLLPGVHPEPRSSSDCVAGQGHYEVYTTRMVERPRGRLLYKTEGTAPNQKFIVEWSNAKNIFTSDLASFQLQLFQGSNGIAFLYKSFKGVSAFEDPPHVSPYNITPSLLVGMEDATGDVGVGQAYLPTGAGFNLPNPLSNQDMMAFQAAQYPAISW
jgi:hypothetical protein